MATMTIRKLVFLTNSTEKAQGDQQIGFCAGRAVERAAEFIRLVKGTVEPHLREGEPKKLAKHLETEHINKSKRCWPCPYQAELSAWRVGLAGIVLWAEWKQLEENRPGDRRALWSAERTLATYLSLKAERLWSNTTFERSKGGRGLPVNGNNRVRLLAAMGEFDIKVAVEEES